MSPVAKLLMILLSAAPLTAIAQGIDTYPSRQVRILCGCMVGGNPDVLGRLVAQKLEQQLGKPFVIENIPGAGGLSGALAAAKAPPDGHSLYITEGLLVNVAMKPDLPVHPLKSFVPITSLAAGTLFLIVHPSVPGTKVHDFVSYAKARPGRLNYGSPGIGFSHHIAMEALKLRTGMDLVHVPYGASSLVNSLIAGDVQAAFFGYPIVSGAIKQGRLRALAVASSSRSAAAPDVPTFSELGIQGMEFESLFGLMAPAATPRPIISRLQSEVAKAMREPDVVKRVNSLGMTITENGGEHYARELRERLDRIVAVVKAANIKAE